MDARNINGETPLVIAARQAKVNHVKLLIENQVKIDLLNSKSWQDQAHLDMLLADGTTVMELVANKVPSTIDVFTQMLDKSIIIDEKECGLVRIFTQTKLGQVSPPIKMMTMFSSSNVCQSCNSLHRFDWTSEGCSGTRGTRGAVNGTWTSSLV